MTSKTRSPSQRIKDNGGRIIAACLDKAALANLRTLQARIASAGELAPSASATIRQALAHMAAAEATQ